MNGGCGLDLVKGFFTWIGAEWYFFGGHICIVLWLRFLERWKCFKVVIVSKAWDKESLQGPNSQQSLGQSYKDLSELNCSTKLVFLLA